MVARTVRFTPSLFDAVKTTLGITEVKDDYALYRGTIELGAMKHVSSDYFHDVMDVIALRPEASAQAFRLQQLALGHRSQADVRVDELIAAVNPEGCPQLVQYIRISADAETFNSVKRAIRADWKRAVPRDEQAVVPVILRKVESV